MPARPPRPVSPPLPYRMPQVPPAPAAPEHVPASLAALLTGLIDYAGLFPPSRLPLEEAVPNYAAYRRSADAWMLGRFICPAARLADLAPYTDLFGPPGPFRVAVLGTGGGDPAAFLAALRDDLGAMAAFEAAHPGRVRADVLEVRLPASTAEGGSGGVAALLDGVAEALAGAPVEVERVYVELPAAGDARRALGTVLEAAARHPLRPGLKLRCGGLTADAFPTVDHVAAFLAACRDARVPFKATAGLHHPIRRLDRDLGVMRHGFLNVFGAGVLAHALELTEPALRQVLRSEDVRAFAFDEDGFAFQDLRITTAQVRAARAFAVSYGSCSFDEPRTDLRNAGLL